MHVLHMHEEDNLLFLEVQLIELQLDYLHIRHALKR